MHDLSEVILSLFIRRVYIVFLICQSTLVFSQTTFQGSFLMSFKSSGDSTSDVPLFWNVQSTANGGKTVMEIEDGMRSKGVSKRVLFNPTDSTWIMLMEIGNIKQGTRIHRAAMYRDTTKEVKTKMVSTRLKRAINGYNCKKIIIETKEYLTELWITDQINYSICNSYKLLCHCGMINENVRKGDWFERKNLKGMILEITSKNKITRESYSVFISELKPNFISPKLFDLSGYKLSDIPEGQNCGPVSAGK